MGYLEVTITNSKDRPSSEELAEITKGIKTHLEEQGLELRAAPGIMSIIEMSLN